MAMLSVPRVRLQNGNYKPALASELIRTRMEHSKCPTENIKSPKLVTLDWWRLKMTLDSQRERERDRERREPVYSSENMSSLGLSINSEIVL